MIQTKQQKEDVGELGAQLIAMPRQCKEFDVGKMLGLADGKIAVRVATKAEQDRAVVGAHDYAKRLAGDNKDAAHDPDILADAKSAFIAHVTCRDAKQPDKLPAFLSPTWMMENLSSEQIAVLVNLANEVRIHQPAVARDIADSTVEAIADLCEEHAGDDIPEAVLANMDREYLTHLVVLLSVKLKQARAAAAPAEAVNVPS